MTGHHCLAKKVVGGQIDGHPACLLVASVAANDVLDALAGTEWQGLGLVVGLWSAV